MLKLRQRYRLQTWVDFAVEWVRKALWSTAHITWVGAQDVGDTGVGGWLGKMGTCEKRVVTKRNTKGEKTCY